eukprot:Nk52_evm15s358 gene=Nk52_evmTU15s358
MDNYAKVRSVGKGTYGEVYLVKHKVEKHYYVIKRMGLKNASRKERKAAQLEVQLLSTLQHPNIITYKESFMDRGGAMYIVMSYCEMGDMYHYLQQRRGKLLGEEQVVEWCIQIALALQYMHKRKILHRDLKTQNIFLTKRNYVKLGDFGIARVLDSTVDMATTLIGTPYYMSPELFSNRPYNHKSDIWSLGCCLVEMCTLKHAFDAKDMNQLVFQILRGKCPPLPGQYSSDLASLAKNLMDQDPDNRPTVDEILQLPYVRNHIELFLTKRGRRPRSVSSPAIEGRPAAPLPPAAHELRANIEGEALQQASPASPSGKVSGLGGLSKEEVLRRGSDSVVADVRRNDVKIDILSGMDEETDTPSQLHKEEKDAEEDISENISAMRMGGNDRGPVESSLPSVPIDPSKLRRKGRSGSNDKDVNAQVAPSGSPPLPAAGDVDYQPKSAGYIMKRAARERRRRNRERDQRGSGADDSSESCNSAANSPRPSAAQRGKMKKSEATEFVVHVTKHPENEKVESEEDACSENRKQALGIPEGGNGPSLSPCVSPSSGRRRGQDDAKDEEELTEMTNLFQRTLEGKEEKISYELFGSLDPPAPAHEEEGEAEEGNGGIIGGFDDDGDIESGTDSEQERELKNTVAQYWAGPSPPSKGGAVGKKQSHRKIHEDSEGEKTLVASINGQKKVNADSGRTKRKGLAGSQPGGLMERIEIVREHCIKGLGKKRFMAACDAVKNTDNSKPGSAEENLNELLGPQLCKKYGNDIQHFLLMEDSMYG